MNKISIKKLSTVIISSFILQACMSVPVAENSSSRHVDYKNKYADRFSVEGIKQRREQEYAQKLTALKKLDPIEDAQRAAASDNYYFLAYYSGRGGSLRLPGISGEYPSNKRCGIKQLDGMGDSIYGITHQQYRVALRKYANQFNQTMVPFCR